MTEPIDLNTSMAALLRLAVAEREERADPELAKRKVELLLAEAGLSYAKIATVTGKNPDAVRKLIGRAQSKK